MFFFGPQTKQQTVAKTHIDNRNTLSLNPYQSAQKYNMVVYFSFQNQKPAPLIFPNNMEIRAL